MLLLVLHILHHFGAIDAAHAVLEIFSLVVRHFVVHSSTKCARPAASLDHLNYGAQILQADSPERLIWVHGWGGSDDRVGCNGLTLVGQGTQWQGRGHQVQGRNKNAGPQ